MYKLVSKSARTEIVINKSRFIGTSFSCLSEEEGKEKVNKIKKEFSDATHNCYAYIFDNLGNGMKFSDDGEPQGTAGLPIFEMIKSKGIVNSGVVVTRYFGGIKLGAGGLVRAYRESALSCLNESVISEMTESVTFTLIVDYSNAKVVDRYFSDLTKLDLSYSDKVSFTFVVKEIEFDNIKNSIYDKLNGRCEIKEVLRDFYAF